MPRRETRRGPALIQFDSKATMASISRAARTAEGRFTNFNQVIFQANRRAIDFLMDEAAANLEKAIDKNGRDQQASTGRLRRAIQDPRSHVVNQDGFLFMRDADVRPEVPYYRAIERGSRHMVGRTDIPILYLPGGRYKQAGIGPTRYQAEGHTGRRTLRPIRNPIKPYSYASKARRKMLSQRLWQGWVIDEAAGRGIEVVFSGTVAQNAGEG